MASSINLKDYIESAEVKHKVSKAGANYSTLDIQFEGGYTVSVFLNQEKLFILKNIVGVDDL